ncbi:MAG: (2Fe-2S)-binding protein [Saccharofermentanales bacterium]|jgi:Fe-S-cluster-containing hydrogenase component 2
MLNETGIASADQVARTRPDAARRAQGPYAVIECFQPIPCNPCSTSCPFDAIRPMADINDCPVIDWDRCTGCGRCVGVCPGLAIFIVDETAEDDAAWISVPYEFTPLPDIGDVVTALDRSGRPVGDAVVRRVNPGKSTQTPLVTLVVPHDRIDDVRFFATAPVDRPFFSTPASEAPLSDETYVCRCEGITLGEVRALIAEGYTTLDEIKRISRAGMGPCQARTCGPLIAAEIARMTGLPREEIAPSAKRPPITPVSIDFYRGGE